MSTTLIIVTLYITYNNEIGYIKTLITLIIMSILITASAISDEIIIAITNLYKTQLSLSFGLNIGFLTLLGNP